MLLYFYLARANSQKMEVKDSNGNILNDGDSVVIIKSLKVKGADMLKRGTVVKNIRLTDNPDEIEGKVNKVQLVLRTEFLRKA
jgi:protein PhnA